jgi:DNA polymerase III epsilon subunit family exonuclease
MLNTGATLNRGARPPARLDGSVGTPAYRDHVILRDWVAAARGRLRHPWVAGVQRRPFDGVEFAIVDVETTGWSPGAAGITEIGAVRVSGGRVRAEFTALVNPGRDIPADITALTGISNSMVATAPPVATVLPRFLDFTRGCVLTAHNAPFDVGFLAAACAGCGLPWPAAPVLDTVALARYLLGEDQVPNCKLSTLAGFFGAPAWPQHRALADARATAAVLAGLLDLLTARGVQTLADLAAREAELTVPGADGPPAPGPQIYGPQIYGPQIYGPQLHGPQVHVAGFPGGPLGDAETRLDG